MLYVPVLVMEASFLLIIDFKPEAPLANLDYRLLSARLLAGESALALASSDSDPENIP